MTKTLWKSLRCLAALSLLSQASAAFAADLLPKHLGHLWAKIDLASPQSVTSEDLSEFNGTLTYRAELKPNALVNIELNLPDIFSVGALNSQKMSISASAISDIAPDCRAIFDVLKLKGDTRCSVRTAQGYQLLKESISNPYEPCANRTVTAYQSKPVCRNVIDLETCNEDVWVDPRESRGPGGRRPLKPGCRTRRECKNEQVPYQKTEYTCAKVSNNIEFTVNTFAPTGNAQTINSQITVDQVQETHALRVGNEARGNEYKAAENFRKKDFTIGSRFFFSLVCESGAVVGNVFNDIDEDQSFHYDEIVRTCGPTAKVYLRSNRVLNFDRGELYLVFENPAVAP